MKILFESKSGKKVEKTFNTLTEAKTFVLKNKKAIKEAQIMEDGYEGAVDKEKNKKFLPSDASTIKNLIMKYAFKFQGNQYVHYEFLANEVEKYILSQTKGQIMEGPLGSGGWSPKKAYNNFKKGREKYKSFDAEMNVKDSFNNRIIDYVSSILKEIAKKEGDSNRYVCGYNKHGLFIDSGWYDAPAIRDMNDPDEGSSRAVSFDSEKYEGKVYLTKLTQYVKEHKSLPSEKQLRQYLEATINKRYSINNAKMKAKKPTRLMSKTDVEDF